MYYEFEKTIENNLVINYSKISIAEMAVILVTRDMKNNIKSRYPEEGSRKPLIKNQAVRRTK